MTKECLTGEATFSAKFATAIESTLDIEQNRQMWERFRHAFEFRAGIPWLGEAQGFGYDDESDEPEGPVAYAIRSSLVFYNQRLPHTAPETSQRELDEEFVSELRTGIAFVAKDKFSVEEFEYSLHYGGHDPEQMTPQEIAREFKEAIHSYWTHAEHGLSPDPW